MSRRVLACCSGGGHLKQLTRLIDRLDAVDQVDWLTFKTGLSQELLEHQRPGNSIQYVPYAAPRDLWNLSKSAKIANRALSRHRYDLALSTGAGIALAVLPLARARGVRACYIESATRTAAPSLTGRVLEYVPGMERFSQYQTYRRRGWSYVGSVFDEFEPGPVRAKPTIRRVLVTVGTTESFGFRRLLERVMIIADPNWEIIWQTGVTDVHALPIAARSSLPASEMATALRQADVVIAHAGTGVALSCFEAGKCPVLVPRRGDQGEHVDDHQVGTAKELEQRGLAVVADASRLDRAAIEYAAARQVKAVERKPTLSI